MDNRMIIRFRGKRYKLSPGLSAFIRGFCEGVYWGTGFCFALIMFLALLAAAWKYAAYH